MNHWYSVSLIRRIRYVARSQWARPTATLIALLLVMPVAAMAQGSPFDTGFTAIQSLFTGTIAKVASLVAIVIGGYGFAHGEPGAKKALAGVGSGACSAFPRYLFSIFKQGTYARQVTAEAAHKSSLQEPAQASHLPGRGAHTVLLRLRRRGGGLQSLQFHPRRYRRFHRRLCLRPLGHKQRPGIPSHPGKIRTLQRAL